VSLPLLDIIFANAINTDFLALKLLVIEGLIETGEKSIRE
jgi:hypothetical protein